MKRLCLILLLILTLAISARAQGAPVPLSAQVTYDLIQNRLVSSVSASLARIEDLLGVPWLDVDLFSLAGIGNDVGLVGTGLRISRPVAKNVDVTFGPWVSFADGEHPRGGLFVGFSVRQ